MYILQLYVQCVVFKRHDLFLFTWEVAERVKVNYQYLLFARCLVYMFVPPCSDHPRISRPLPEVVVTRPEGELIVNFTFTSSPMPVVRWRLDDRILKVTSIPGSKRTFTEKLELAEEQGGLLTATVEMCGVSVSTETKLIVVGECF